MGITVGLFDEYGPAQRLYAQRGYIPDAQGACQGQQPLRRGMHVTVDDDLIIWLPRISPTETSTSHLSGKNAYSRSRPRSRLTRC